MAIRFVNRFQSRLATTRPRSRGQSPPRAVLREFEILESRQLLATFTVTNLQVPEPARSVRRSMSANRQPGPDTIDFHAAGTIRVGQTSLPAITGPVTIDGSTVPSLPAHRS